MNMIVRIEDEFDLEKIARSGQCFRVVEDGGFYRFITCNSYIYIKKLSESEYEASCDEKEWQGIWRKYFDLDTNYHSIRTRYYGINPFLDRALDEGEGLRILKQDAFETLISFILSQRKSIRAISSSIEKLCLKYGKVCNENDKGIYFFPSPKQLSFVSSFQDLSVGYRAEYIKDAVCRVINGDIDLTALENKDDATLLSLLMKINGVGIKVASCVALFAYKRLGIAPVDVWIKRVIDNEFGGKSPFEDFGKYAGLVQQYLFYYARTVLKQKK